LINLFAKAKYHGFAFKKICKKLSFVKTLFTRFARGGGHLLRLLQDDAGLEVRARLRVQSEVQGGEVHHRARPHDQGERLGEERVVRTER